PARRTPGPAKPFSPAPEPAAGPGAAEFEVDSDRVSLALGGPPLPAPPEGADAEPPAGDADELAGERARGSLDADARLDEVAAALPWPDADSPPPSTLTSPPSPGRSIGIFALALLPAIAAL